MRDFFEEVMMSKSGGKASLGKYEVDCSKEREIMQGTQVLDRKKPVEHRESRLDVVRGDTE